MIVDRIAMHLAERRQRAAQVRLAAMVEAARIAPATVQYRQRRAAALKATRNLA
jgi:hypothetical protein